MIAPEILASLEQVVGPSALLTKQADLRAYECDGLTNFRAIPAAVALPDSAKQVQGLVEVCARHQVPFVARGSGTGLSGGALPSVKGIVISLARLNRILHVDIQNARVVVEPGVINAHVTRKVAPSGFFYAPDPSSQAVCSIGGNVAENSGGAHCLKYGFTTNHVLGLEMVLPDATIVMLGGMAQDLPGYDLTGVVVGSEGTLGIVTKVILRIVRKPASVQTMIAAFHSVEDAAEAVSAIIEAGIVPAAIEMMDRLSITAVESAVHAGYPECDALLLVELDGCAVEVHELSADVTRICTRCGSFEQRLAQSEDERALFWKGRKAAFAAMGRVSPNYIVQDGVIPRTTLCSVLAEIQSLADNAGLRVANVFHAGDGNLHPLVLYDRAISGQEDVAMDLSLEILRACVRAGGSITGEHGVGVEKMSVMSAMYAEPDLQTMQLVRCAFDPGNLCNPDKIFPRTRLCAERAGPYHPHPLETAGVAELF